MVDSEEYKQTKDISIIDLLKDCFVDDLYADVNRWKWGLFLFIIISLILTHLSLYYLLIIPIYLVAYFIRLSFVGARD